MCSFLGGMRAVTWTQVAQYIILIIAYMIPVVWLSVKQTGIPLPQLVYGKQLEKVTALEEKFIKDPKELQVRDIFKARADDANAKLKGLPGSYDSERAKLAAAVEKVKAENAPAEQMTAAETALAAFPKDAAAAKAQWTKDAGLIARAAPPLRHAEAFPGKDDAARDVSRRNFLALVFCLMVGTAALPHILMRYYTTPSVRQARESVFWSLFFIFLLYFTAPALGVLAKFDVYSFVVGSEFAKLPQWVASWTKVDPALLSIVDINKDGIVQLAEMSIGGDIIVLATPEIAGLPYVISGLVAAGGLAAALSTADGLLLTIANALSHDFYYKMLDPNASTARRVTISKILLLVVALIARDRGRPEACRHPVPRVGGVLARCGGVLPGARMRDLLEARQQVGGDPGHDRRPRHYLLLHGDDPALAARRVRRHRFDRRPHVVGHRGDLGRPLGRAARVRGHHRRQLADAGTQPRGRRNWSSMSGIRT